MLYLILAIIIFAIFGWVGLLVALIAGTGFYLFKTRKDPDYWY